MNGRSQLLETVNGAMHKSKNTKKEIYIYVLENTNESKTTN